LHKVFYGKWWEVDEEVVVNSIKGKIFLPFK